MRERIAELGAHGVALPFRRPYATAAGRLERREMAILELRGSSGLRGWGDAVPMSLRGGPDLQTTIADLRGAEPALVGTSLDLASAEAARTSIAQLLAPLRAAALSPGALAAIEVALLDLAGKALETPAWRILGASESEPVECNGTLDALPPRVAAERAAALAEAGFKSIKVKVGDSDDGVAGDLARLEAIRQSLGPDTSIRIDANRAYTVSQASEVLDHGDELGIELAEQPCATPAELRELKRICRVPLVADESANDAKEAATLIATGACDAVTAKLAKVGGPSAALAVARVAPTYLSSALDSAIGILAAVHTAQALGAPRAAHSAAFPSGLAHGLASSSLLADDVADPGVLTGPTIEAPDAPGIGVEVDEDRLRRLGIGER